MSSLPPDIYEHVSRLAMDITNATLADDSALADSLYQNLRLYHEEQLVNGRTHPFILETLADYTDDAAQAFHYYEEAIALSRRLPGDEPTHTILIAIGERLLELKRTEHAEAFLRDGRTEALRRNDLDAVKQAHELLTKLA
ncbi:MAG TPA: hypothetical protein VGH19_24210 [Verrucomicrobiae bacterium]